MYDIHCHVLPGIDDGAGTMDETLKMLRLSWESGVSGVVATPHSMRGNTLQRVSTLTRQVRAELAASHIPLRLYVGQELMLDEEGICNLYDKKAIPLNGSRYLLVEFDLSEEDEEFAYHALESVRENRLIPIVAHPERYVFFCRNIGFAEEIHRLGGLLQVNRGSLQGRHGYEAQETAWRLLEERAADFVASDGHSPYMRTPHLKDVHEEIAINCSFSYAEELLHINPEKVLRNESISPRGWR